MRWCCAPVAMRRSWLLPYGIVGQLVASARGAGGDPGAAGLGSGRRGGPLAVGAELVIWLGQVCRGRGMVLTCIDDLQWADGPSARALLFALRRLQADQVLVVVAARAGQLSGLGEAWSRFLNGDHRAGRIVGRPGTWGCGGAGRGAGGGELPRRAVGRLLEYTGGNPLHIRACWKSRGPRAWMGPAGRYRLRVRWPAMVLVRVGALSPAAQHLIAAAAVLGHHCRLAAAAVLAGLDDPLPALEEALATGVLTEQPGGGAAGIGFPICWCTGPSTMISAPPGGNGCMSGRLAWWIGSRRWRTGWRRRWVRMTGWPASWRRRGREARDLGRAAQAADWLAQAAAASTDPAAADRPAAGRAGDPG